MNVEKYGVYRLKTFTRLGSDTLSPKQQRYIPFEIYQYNREKYLPDLQTCTKKLIKLSILQYRLSIMI